MTVMTEYWYEGCFIYDQDTNKIFVCNSPDATDYSAYPQGIRSDTIVPSFTWEGSTTDDTKTELLGSGFVWTMDDETASTGHKRRFVSLKEDAHAYNIEIKTIARSADDVKAWKTELIVGYDTDISMMFATTKVLHETSGATSWEIDFATGSYDTYYNYVKCEATGATDTSISWKSVGTYVEV